MTNSTELYKESIELSASLLRMFVPHINCGTAPSIPQDNSRRTVYKKVMWEEHAKQIMDWRNDPVTLSMFYHQEPKVWHYFGDEFRYSYFQYDQTIHPVFAILNSHRVGFLKFSPVLHPYNRLGLTVDISINISPSFRGKGLGAKVLKACSAYLCGKNVGSIYAEILSHNLASIKMFKASGFLFVEQKEKIIPDTGKTYVIQCFLLEMTKNHILSEVCDNNTKI